MDRRSHSVQIGESANFEESTSTEQSTTSNVSVLEESYVIGQSQRNSDNCCKKSLIIAGVFCILVSLLFALLGFLLLKDCKTRCGVLVTASQVLRMLSGSLFVIGIILLIVRACQLGIEPEPLDDSYTVVSTVTDEGLEKSPAIASLAYHEMPRVTQWTCLNDDGMITCYDVKYGYRSETVENKFYERTEDEEPPPSYEQALQMVNGQV